MRYNLKKIKKSLFITLLVFSVPALSIFPSTNSKYYTERTDWLTYQTTMNTLYQGTKGLAIGYNSGSSTYEDVRISFSFPKSNNALSTDKDIYKINVNNNCEIISVSSKAKDKNKINNSEYQISYAAGASSDTIRVEYKCKYGAIHNESKNLLQDKITITESFNSEGYDYKYLEGYFEKSYSEYRTEKPFPTAVIEGNKLTVPKDVEIKYEEIEGWLFGYFNDDPDSSAYKLYFSEVYNNPDNTSEENKLKQDELIAGVSTLDGLSAVSKSDGIIVYTIEKNYINYALTKYWSINNLFYFMGDDWSSVEGKADANALFKYYIDKYAYANTTEEYDKIIKYVDKKGGITSFMVTPPLNNYIKWSEEYKRISIQSFDDLLSFLDSVPVISKEFKYDASTDMKNARRDIISSIENLSIIDNNGNEISLSGDFVTHLRWNAQISTFLSTRHTEAKSTYIIDDLGSYYPNKVSTPGTDKPYFAPANTNVKLIVRAYSNGVDTNGVEIILVEDGNDYNLTFNATDDATSINEILGIVKPGLEITPEELESGGDIPKGDVTLTITKDTKINIKVTN